MELLHEKDRAQALKPLTHRPAVYGRCALNPEVGWFKDICLVLPFPLPFHLTLTLVFLSNELEKLCVRHVAPHFRVFRPPEDASVPPAPAGFSNSSTHWKLI